ncbi:hypothetical protein [Azospirillum sp. sgz301742]
MSIESVFGLSPWIGLSLISVVLVYAIVLGGWVLAKAGRSPLWVLLLLIPYVNVLAVWAFAYARWPFVDGANAVPGPSQDTD